MTYSADWITLPHSAFLEICFLLQDYLEGGEQLLYWLHKLVGSLFLPLKRLANTC